MANARFMLLQLPGHPKVVTESIHTVLNKALDWIEVGPNSWLIWTSSSPEQWYKRLQKAFGTDTRSFICVIDPEQRHGRMPKVFWQFLEKKR